ncbi:MAG: peptide-methionine (S)-S-oxide reductase MsrA [Bryobacteraceae bacterium]|nr:peptide-methionine (S)-S-oxide reductase MsrA [Solibacteraceae bacterium]MCO5352253.1 peptide-methionine (S)-S-oxide reductase MsrA [Bryobacteraceae bacterium]
MPRLATFAFMTLMAACAAPGAGFPDPAVDQKPATGLQKAILGGGCFWCTEVVYQHVEGVTKVVSGYSGGSKQTANYRAVTGGDTGHAEVIEVTYDPKKVTFGQLLRVFFDVAHDPTQLNRQGPDYGPQYRSVIFYTNEEQKQIAEAYIAQLTEAKAFKKKIVTEVSPLTAFYPAEGYHQDYVNQNPGNPYVQVNALPKVDKLKKACPRLVRKKK